MTGNTMKQHTSRRLGSALATILLLTVPTACGGPDQTGQAAELTDAQLEELVRRSYQYVAMYNVNNKQAAGQGWNTCLPDTQPKDDSMRDIARPNNDTFYIPCMLDLRGEPIVLDMPALDSKYVSLMITGYDHYVNIPMSTREGDFGEPVRMLIYSERTEGYDEGEEVEGVDRYFEATGDFVSAVFRVMPHTNEPERFERIREQMQSVEPLTLPEFRGEPAEALDDPGLPPVGVRDADIFENNLLEVMQFVFNHTTFDPANELDRELLALYEPLGVVPGETYDPERVARLDGQRVRQVSEAVFAEEIAKAGELTASRGLFQPKGEIGLDLLLFQSVVGPVGQPAAEAVYPAVTTADGEPMNAAYDYVVRMSPDELPPAEAFWSLTLYDTENGFFIPNDRKKYSVGENAGMRLNDGGGIEIHISAEQPAGVPDENWLPLNRGDYGIDLIMRLYAPDLEAYDDWRPPMAERIEP